MTAKFLLSFYFSSSSTPSVMLGLDPSIHANATAQKKISPRLVPVFGGAPMLAALPLLGQRLERMTWGSGGGELRR